MPDLPFPLSGSTLIVGPSNSGKTRLTAQALDAWIGEHGAEGVVVLEFAPEVERDGVLLGGRLSQFTRVPDAAWHGVLEAHAPRADSDSEMGAMQLAEENATRAYELVDAAPADPTAVFVNDATIALQAEADATGRLTSYCDRATVAVLNAFESDELGSDDPVSRNERAALRRLRAWTERVVELG
ncbi:hypothetical protein [Haloarchaeobius sp. HME9146]|uniref:hypothetical protein n=1 Tax=Haloarchaeobius sp. HME9146 TaxID=2978732 RepID=UPI0021C2136D|nr:hypothetical protein [Haloarchaeobius sp. HME9146]MCT9098269.1 hypothetical protein [Haloarchaeobius sp. HME9146]